MLPLLLLLFLIVPIVEIYVIIQVGQAIGPLWTVALLLADSIAGAALMRSQGRAVWRRFNRTLGDGRAPTREVADGALVLFGGALLLTPGFCTDILGALFLLPPTRAAIRAFLLRQAGRRFASPRPSAASAAPPAGPGDPRAAAGTGTSRAPRTTSGRPRAPAAVTVEPALEAPRPPAGNDFSDAVTCAFGDPRADVYCVARLGLAGGAPAGWSCSSTAASRSPSRPRAASRPTRRAAGTPWAPPG